MHGRLRRNPHCGVSGEHFGEAKRDERLIGADVIGEATAVNDLQCFAGVATIAPKS
jgi:hypothetical protein